MLIVGLVVLFILFFLLALTLDVAAGAFSFASALYYGLFALYMAVFGALFAAAVYLMLVHPLIVFRRVLAINRGRLFAAYGCLLVGQLVLEAIVYWGFRP